jgi:hypothetical protein
VRRNSGAGYNFNWKNLSAVVGITFLSFYFRWYARSVKAPQVIDFLQALQRCIPRPLTVIWGRLASTPQPDGSQLSPDLERADSQRIPAKLRARVESSGIHLGLLEAARIAERRPQGLLGAQRSRP